MRCKMKKKMLNGGTRRINDNLRAMLSSDNVFGMPPFDFINQSEHLSFFLSNQHCFNVMLVK